MNELDEIVYVCNIKTYQLLYANKKARELFALPEELSGRYCYEVVKGRDDPCEDCDNCMLKHDEVRKQEEYNSRYQKTFLKSDKLIYWHGYEARMEVAIDITELQLVKEELKERLETEYLLIDCINAVNSSEDLDGSVNETMEKIGRYFGADRIALYEGNKKRRRVRLLHRWEAKPGTAQIEKPYTVSVEILSQWESLYRDHSSGCFVQAESLKEVRPEIYDLLKAMGVEKMLCVAIVVPNGKIGYIGIDNPRSHLAGCSLIPAYLNYVIDEVQRRRMQEELEYLSCYDELTETGNRRGYSLFRRKLDREGYRSLGIVAMNVNEMNAKNNMYGQEYGDGILKHLGRYLVRVFSKENVFRTSGDEFVVFCVDMDRDTFVEKVSQIGSPLHDSTYYSVAVGQAWDDSSLSYETLLESAKEYMQQEKRDYYLGNKKISADHKKQEVESLLNAIEEGRFKLYFQPKVDIWTEEIAGAEALVRYEDEEYGVVSPGRFIRRLEAEKTICYLDCHIFEQVGDLLEQWYQRGEELMAISLNFSRVTLTWPRLMSVLEQYAGKWHFPMEYMEVEITESVGEIGRKTLIMLVKQLKALGLKVSLDDFGVQYTNLSVLTAVDFDVLKLDKSLIDELSVNRKSRIVVQSVVDVCKKIHTKCLAEGVENREQLEELRAGGVDYIQGFLFGKPMPREEFMKKIGRGAD